jgi:hypothetical protein
LEVGKEAAMSWRLVLECVLGWHREVWVDKPREEEKICLVELQSRQGWRSLEEKKVWGTGEREERGWERRKCD